jgi:hypothetical protein
MASDFDPPMKANWGRSQVRSEVCFAPLERPQDITKAAPNHSPDFFVDESALVIT